MRAFSNAALNLRANHIDGNPSMNKLPIFKTKKTDWFVFAVYALVLEDSVVFVASLHGVEAWVAS